MYIIYIILLCVKNQIILNNLKAISKQHIFTYNYLLLILKYNINELKMTFVLFYFFKLNYKF